MKKEDAIKLRDENRNKLIDTPFDDKRTGWDIKDIIVSIPKYVGDVYQKMYDSEVSNEIALGFFPSVDDAFKVYVISHQWPWGSGDLLFEDIESYFRANPS